jgi:uncharacterized protein
MRSSSRRLRLAALVAGAVLLGGAALPGSAPAAGCPVQAFTYKHGIVSFTEHGTTVDVHVEVADTEPSREVGLMCRISLDPNDGMLFVFDGNTDGPFWMKNTLIPLSIVFLDDHWRPVAFRDMRVAPNPADPPPSDVWGPDRPYRYALEVNRGFFKVHDLDEQARVHFTPGDSPKP